MLINKRERVGLRLCRDPKAFIEYSNDMNDAYQKIDEYNPIKKKCKILIVFYDMITDILSNKNLQPIVTELFITSRKMIISLVFITQSYFAVLKDIRKNSTHFSVIKITKKQELKQTFIKNSDNGLKDFMKLCRKYIVKLHSFLVIDTTLLSGNPLSCRRNFL